jgi:hypothetical protein
MNSKAEPNPLLQKQAANLQHRIKLQQDANSTITNLSQQMQGEHAATVRQWADRWKSLQVKRLSLLQDVLELENKGCASGGFFNSLYTANEELITSTPRGGVAIFEELTGLSAVAKNDSSSPTEKPSVLRSLFEQLFGRQPLRSPEGPRSQ